MATPTIASHGSDVVVFSWTLTSADATGSPVTSNFAAHSDRTVQIVSSAWGGSTVALQGSNDGTNWNTLSDGDGTAISYSSGSAIHSIQENPLYVRPALTTPGTGATVVVTLCMRKVR